MSANARVRAVMGHLYPTASGLSQQPCAASDPKKAKTGIIYGPIETTRFPTHRHEVLNWHGWGYKDSGFEVDDQSRVTFRGKRYELAGKSLPGLLAYFTKLTGRGPSGSTTKKEMQVLAPSVVNNAFLAEIGSKCGEISFENADRLYRSHGQSTEDEWKLEHKSIERAVDVVVWPECHNQCELIVATAVKHNVVIIPFGGGTSASDALTCPTKETRMIVSLDTSKMNHILFIDKTNMVVRLECGIVGEALEKKLEEYGVCTGHEPDSIEFSTVGGWVATRASGFKKNIYGNIEDMLVSVKIVTPKGTIEKSTTAPRISSGPDIHHFILGSEGTLGIITEVTLKIREVPEARVYGSLVFPSFENGVACLRELAKVRGAPASIRLVDNEQFQMGRALKSNDVSLFQQWIESAKTFYVTKIKGFNPTELSVATLLFEGTKHSVELQQKSVIEIAAKHGGISGGEENGKRGYLLTYNIAYLRDLAANNNFMSISFETSAPWDCVVNVSRNTKERLIAEMIKHGVKGTPLATCRVTQTYDAGACIYFYFGFVQDGIEDPIHLFHTVEQSGRDEVIANGGSISHHHGVGKCRKRWLTKTVSPGGVEMLRAVKAHMDPTNIFGCNNLFDV